MTSPDAKVAEGFKRAAEAVRKLEQAIHRHFKSKAELRREHERAWVEHCCRQSR